MEQWNRVDAWILVSAAMRGRIRIKSLNGLAEHMMHSQPTPTEISTTMSKLLSAGIVRFDGFAIRANPEAFRIADHAMNSPISPWEPGGWIDRALAELERIPVRELHLQPPSGFASWYDLLAESGMDWVRRRLKGT